MSLELAGLASSFTALNAITKSMIGLRDAVKLNAEVDKFQKAMIEANAHVIATQQEYLSLIARTEELAKETVRLKDWIAEKEKYSVWQISPGVFAYFANDAVGDFESSQKFCCTCFDQGIKSTLQQSSEYDPTAGDHVRLLTCARCPKPLRFARYSNRRPNARQKPPTN